MVSVGRIWIMMGGLALSAAVLAVVGCGQNDVERKVTSVAIEASGTASGPTAGTETVAATTLLADWPTGPDDQFAGALILTGEMLGYHEPCGCAAKQKGGLLRRAIVIERLRKQGWNLALADLGSISQDPQHDRGGPDQTRLKFNQTLKALELLGYSAIGLSANDLRLGTGESLMQFDNILSLAPEGLKAVSANARPNDGLGIEKSLPTSTRTTLGPLRVGITSVLDPAAFTTLKDADKELNLTVVPPEDALPAVLSDLDSDTDLQVLLVQGPVELARELAKRFPSFEIVMCQSETADPAAEPEMLNDGSTRLVQVGTKGMYLGILGFYTDSGRTIRYRRLELNDRYDKDRALAAPMAGLIGDALQESFRDAGTLESFPRRPYSLFNAPAGAIYAGVETCRHCHPKTVAKWESTKHAHAYEPLINDPRDNGRNREHDASCVSCHTTGFEYVSGFTTVEATSFLKGNQCENCHGPGSAHAGEPQNAAYRLAMARTRDDFESNRRCIRCHDEDNDPKFDFSTYWPQIMHNGLDNYTDPGVRQGIEPVRTEVGGVDGAVSR